MLCVLELDASLLMFGLTTVKATIKMHTGYSSSSPLNDAVDIDINLTPYLDVCWIEDGHQSACPRAQQIAAQFGRDTEVDAVHIWMHHDKYLCSWQTSSIIQRKLLLLDT